MTRKKKLSKPRSKIAAPITLPQPGWDMGATGMANRHGLEQEDVGEVDVTTGRIANPNGVKRVRRVDMLEFWHRHGTITASGYAAAVTLRNAFENTQRSPDTSFEQDRVDSSPKPDHAVTIQIDRISAFHRVNRFVAADDQAIVHHCVLDGGTPAGLRVKGARPYQGRNYRQGLAALSDALDRLAKAMEGAR